MMPTKPYSWYVSDRHRDLHPITNWAIIDGREVCLMARHTCHEDVQSLYTWSFIETVTSVTLVGLDYVRVVTNGRDVALPMDTCCGWFEARVPEALNNMQDLVCMTQARLAGDAL